MCILHLEQLLFYFTENVFMVVSLSCTDLYFVIAWGKLRLIFSPFSLLLRFTFQTSFCEIKKESWNRIVYAYNSQSTFISVSISHFTIREIVISPDFKVTAYSGGIRLLPLQMATTQQTGVADCHQSGTKLNYCLAAWFGRCYSCVGEKQL